MLCEFWRHVLQNSKVDVAKDNSEIHDKAFQNKRLPILA